jgi:hypothetical protein
MANGRSIDHSAYLIRLALQSPTTYEARVNADSYLIGHLERNRFNSTRAQEVYTVVLDNAVWGICKCVPNSRQLYLDYLKSDIRHKRARELVAKFTDDGRRPDQRPARRHFKWLLGS